jgi:7-keto-8-aminopelargonate synthetase-like enzyme
MPSDTIDIKMGTLSKAIPSVGGYIAGEKDLIRYLKHLARGFIYSAALPPAQAAAAMTAFDVIEEEPERIAALQTNYLHFARRLREAGFDLLQTKTAIMPVLCGDTDVALELAKYCHERGIFVQAIIAPVVPAGSARLRACVCATHTMKDIDYCADVLIEGGRLLNILSK